MRRASWMSFAGVTRNAALKRGRRSDDRVPRRAIAPGEDLRVVRQQFPVSPLKRAARSSPSAGDFSARARAVRGLRALRLGGARRCPAASARRPGVGAARGRVRCSRAARQGVHRPAGLRRLARGVRRDGFRKPVRDEGELRSEPRESGGWLRDAESATRAKGPRPTGLRSVSATRRRRRTRPSCEASPLSILLQAGVSPKKRRVERRVEEARRDTKRDRGSSWR